MATIQRFEDIEAWKKARELTKRVYSITRQGPLSRDYGLCNQIRRACVSVMSNIAEGFERDGNGEFKQFLAIAKGSAGEVRSQLYVLLDGGYVTQMEFEELFAISSDTVRLLSGFIKYLQSTELQGRKYST